jgi:glucose-1-phosphate thymidylyltransferase
MKGVILEGGMGTRLLPLTKVTNKHLLPIYDKPMIYYPIQCLVNAGINDIMIVTGGNDAGDFLRLLGNGKEFGLKDIAYTYQEGAGGIADALRLAEHFIDNDRFVVILGDNIIEGNIRRAAADFYTQRTGAKLLLKEVSDPQRFGGARFDDAGKIVEIIEKPANPPGRMAVTGIYLYDADVFRICQTLKPSGRGELEITDVNNHYLQRGDLTHEVLEGWWTDAGTFESLHRAGTYVAEGGANHVEPVAANVKH